MTGQWALVIGLMMVSAAAADQLPVGIPRQRLQGSLETERTDYQVGESINVTVVLTNVSKVPIRIDAWPGNWLVRIFDERGNILTPIAAADVLRPLVEPMTLAPGEQWKTTIKRLSLTTGLPGSTPNWKYPPLKPGTYWLGAQYSAQLDAHHPEVWSGGLRSRVVRIRVR